jgi:hypothetical protein
MSRGSCFGCWYLLQTGSGDCVCLRYDPYEEGGTVLDDDPEPLYSDCYDPEPPSPRS